MFGSRRRWYAYAQRCDGLEELAAIANPSNADVLEIFHGQLGKYLGVDTVVAKRRLVLLQPQAPQPRRNVHAALPIVEPFSLVGFKLTRSAARNVLFHRSPQRAATTATRAADCHVANRSVRLLGPICGASFETAR